jgi:uncharacterized membrane protein
MKNKIIYLLLIVGIIASGQLVYSEILHEGTCPKLSVIPACYLVFLSFLIPLIAQILKRGNVFYYLFTGFALALATYASIGQLIGKIECPKTDFGWPMCYISFVIFLCLVLLKIFDSKKSH